MSDERSARVKVTLPDGTPIAEWVTHADGTHEHAPPPVSDGEAIEKLIMDLIDAVVQHTEAVAVGKTEYVIELHRREGVAARKAITAALSQAHQRRLDAEQEALARLVTIAGLEQEIIEVQREREKAVRAAEQRAQENFDGWEDGDLAAGIIADGLFGPGNHEGRDSVADWAREIVAKLRAAEERASTAEQDARFLAESIIYASAIGPVPLKPGTWDKVMMLASLPTDQETE